MAKQGPSKTPVKRGPSASTTDAVSAVRRSSFDLSDSFFSAIYCQPAVRGVVNVAPYETAKVMRTQQHIHTHAHHSH